MLNTKPCNKPAAALLASLLLITGCAEAPAQFDIRQTRSDNAAVVLIYRPDAMANIMISPEVLVDGKPVFVIHNNQYHALQLAAGAHRIRLDLTERYQGEHEITLDTRIGQSYFLRIDTAMQFQQNRPYDRSFDIQSVAEAEALPQIAGCKPAQDKQVQPAAADTAVEKAPGYSSQTFRNPFSH